ncbi:MAG TPA: flagellar hook-basal body complex protein FliE [Acidisarcina sp.]
MTTPGMNLLYPAASPLGPGSPGLSGPAGGVVLPDPIDGAPAFGDVLKSTLAQVNQLEGGAHAQVNSVLAGGGGDMSSVMIAVEKADVAFQLMMQVRNKIVSAYQDVEKMAF